MCIRDRINYPFGKDKALRRKPKIKLKVINLYQISDKFAGQKEVNLQGYKVLSKGELKEKMIIYADAASESATGKIKKAGGDIILKKA